ncbi:MAG: hypothetical protein R3F02_20685 [Thiolinea sp.]
MKKTNRKNSVKPVWILPLLPIFLSACTEPQAPEAEKLPESSVYDDSWYISSGWPGEYPNGFSILKDGVVLEGRAEMNKAAAKTLNCPVPRLANFNPWNHQRVDADQLEFISASKKFTIPVVEDVDVPVFDDAHGDTLALKKGAELTYLTYIAEGFALMAYQGKEYQVDMAGLEEKVSFAGQPDIADDLWVNIPCQSGQRGWVLHSEVVGVDGVRETEHTVYGESPDLAQ